MHAFAASRTAQLRVLIDKDIVDVIISEMMFHPEDMDGITRARLLESFVPTLDSSEDAADAGDVSRYAITVTNTKQLQSVAQYLAAGLSFRQVSQVIMETKEVLGIGSIGSCSEGIVSRYARFICATNLQCIAELLRQCWAFSVALDMATTWRPRTAMFASASATNPLCMTSTFCPSLCMSGTQARLFSTRSPGRWTLSSRTGARRLLERLWMARRR
jgi:hypothetical protein